MNRNAKEASEVITLDLTPSQAKKIRTKAAAAGITTEEFVSRELERYVKRLWSQVVGKSRKPIELAMAMAKNTDADGLLTVAIELRLWPQVIVAAARKAQHTGATVDAVINEFVERGPGGTDGLMDYLSEYMSGELPPKGS